MSKQDQASFGEHRSQRPAADEPGDQLTAHDLAACEAVFGGAPSGHPQRAEQLNRLLSLLGTPTQDAGDNRELIVDLTLARVARARRQAAEDAHAGAFIGGDLSPDDDDALEALVAAEMDAAQVPSGLRRRAERLQSLLSNLNVTKRELGSTNDLVQRTLARVQESIGANESRFSTVAIAESGEQVGSRPRFRMADLMTVAALVLVGFGVLMPMAGAVQGASRRMSCQANLSAAGLGFGLYAGANRDVLPLASASPAGRPWWFVGKGPEQSNAANLYTLVRTGSAKVSDLACAGNKRAIFGDPRESASDWGCLEEVSYSYQNMFASERPSWSGSNRTIVLIDRSPVILKAYNKMVIDPLENSPNHGGRGQAALTNDGSVRWLRSPVLQNGDNIWLPRLVEDVIRQLTQPRIAQPLKGTESPAGADDVFVGP